MYTEVDLSVLKPAIARLSKVATMRTTLPVLQNIHFKTTDAGCLKLSATNLNEGLSFIVPAKIQNPGETTASGRMLSSILGRLHCDTLTIASTDMKGGNRFTLAIPDGPTIGLPAINAEEFPPMFEPIAFTERYLIDGGGFRALCQSTAFAVTTDESRPILQHACFDFEPGKLTVSTTNGFRIAVKSITLESPVERPFQALIPGDLIKKALNLLPIITGEKVTIGFKNSNDKRTWVMISAGNAWLTGCLFDSGAKFPDWRTLVSNKHKYTYKLNRKQLVAALDLSLLITGKYDARVMLDFPNGKMSTSHEERGEFEFSMPAVAVGESAQFVAAINNHYLIDGLRHMKGDTVTMYFDSPKNTFQFEDDGGMLYVAMPLFIG
jgi:DNA polymerase III subunit beta